MFKKASLFLMGGLVAFSAIAAASATISWFTQKASIEKGDSPIEGSTLGSYFAYGNGSPTTEENPNDRVYGITFPRHLYNLAWLQYLGFFNKAAENGKQYYFELGNNIDMTGWTLPPIGDENNPFIGNFNGNGYVIENLTISNNFSDFKKHPGEVKENEYVPAHIVGFFGVIGDLNHKYTNAETGATLAGKVYQNSINKMIDTGLYKPTIVSNVKNTLLGVAAGYVDAEVKNVAVDSPTVNFSQTGTTNFGGYTTNLSNYGLIGYCTKSHLRTTDIKSVRANTPIVTKNAADETGTSYGASIPMKTIWEDITGRRSASTSTYPYETARSEHYNYDGSLEEVTNVTTVDNTTSGQTMWYEVTNDGYVIASYSYHQNSKNDDDSYMYMYGKTNIKNYTTAVKIYKDTDAYYIYNGNNYLYRNGTDVGNRTGTSDTAKWIYKNNRLYNQNDTTTYYLTSSEDGMTLSLSTTTSDYNAWTLDEESGYFKNNYTHFYLVYDNGWTTRPQLEYTAFTIRNGNNYLYANSTTTVTNTTTANNATKWVWDGEKIYYLYQNGKYYLTTNASGTLSLSTTPSNYNNWTIEGTTFKNVGYNGYLVFNPTGSAWLVTGSKSYTAYYIYSGAHYLVNNGTSGITDTTAAGSRVLWIYDSNKLYIISGSMKYYLTANDNGTLSLSTTATNYNSWSLDSTSGIFANSGNNQYLVYDSGWITVEKLSFDRYTIRSGGNYLYRSSTSAVGNTTTAGSATNWYFDSETGKLFDINNNTKYYLTAGNSATLTVSTTPSNDNTWTLSDGYFYNSTRDRYVVYDSGWKGQTSKTYSETTYYFRSTGGYYLTANSNFNGFQADVTQQSDATEWFKDTNGYYCLNSNGTKFYIAYNSGLVLSSSPSYYFVDHTNGGRNYLRARNYYYLRYNNGWTTRTSRNTNDALTITNGSVTRDYVVTLAHSTTTYSASSSSSTVNYDSTNTSADFSYSASKSSTTTEEYLETRNDNHTLTTKSTFIPLKYNENKTDIHSDNTGYIVSGGHSGAADVRISRYRVSIQYSGQSYTTYNLGAAFGDQSTTYNETTAKHFEIVTRTHLSNGYARISDDYNANNPNSKVDSQIRGYTKYTTEQLGLKKYSSARKTFHATMKAGATYIYGLHFMNAQISKNNVIAPDRVMVNGWEYKDNKAYEYVPRKVDGKYVKDEDGNIIKDVFDRGDVGGNFELPEDSVEFNLSENGTINFFAGSFFTGNDTFFSLHRIVRDTSDSDGDGSTVDIKEILEIRKVYENSDYDILTNPNAPRYVYQYKNANGAISYSEGTRGTELFDCAWITDIGNEMVDYAAYYFEIPAIPGEYALGSVSGHTGAYLIYLDIGAADDSNDKMLVDEVITTSVSIYAHPDGIDFQVFATNANGELTFATVNGDDSATVIIPEGVSGKIEFMVTEHLLSCGPPSAGSITQTTYKPDNYSVKCNNTELTLVVSDTQTITDHKMTTYTFDSDNNRLLTEIEHSIRTTYSDGSYTDSSSSDSTLTTITEEQYDLIRVVANDEIDGVKHFEFYYYAPLGTNITINCTYEYSSTSNHYTYVFEIVADYEVDIHVTYIRTDCDVSIKRVKSDGSAMEIIPVVVDNSYTIYNKPKP